MKGILGVTALAVLTLVGILLFRLGAFQAVSLSEAPAGPFKVVFKRHVGAYHHIGKTIESVEGWAKQNGESCRLSFGEYLDDVDKVQEDRLQSNGGCVVDKDWSAQLPADLAYRELPGRSYVIAEFEGAPSIGPQKVYPKAKEHIAARQLEMDGAVIEMYEILTEQKVKTRYYFPVKPARPN